jgi:hypothetical protein
MKKCPYCGAEYNDEATSCPADGTALIAQNSAATRKTVTGLWRGVYDYAEHTLKVRFALKLKQGWSEAFEGKVMEDTTEGVPGTGAITGYFRTPKIEFTKQMPVGYFRREDGSWITMREHFISAGYKCENELPSPTINYQGTFIDANRVQGTWIINPHRIQLDDQWLFSRQRTSGFWCAEFMGTELSTDISGGPSEALYDKSLLSPQELEAVKNFEVENMGMFSVPDAERILRRFEQEGIVYEINRDENAGWSTDPYSTFGGMARLIEIWVATRDLERADAIIRGDDKV